MARKSKAARKHHPHRVDLHSDFYTDTELETGRPKPIGPFLALLLAAILVFAALGLLLGINHQPVWPSDEEGNIYAFVQPASILSLILSLIGICITYAYSEGVGYAWWRIQQKPSTEVDALQNAFEAGDGIFGALRYCLHFFWISLACLSLLLLTLNGFVLQGAISTELYTELNQTTVRVPIVRQLDLGFSSPSSALSLYGTNWSQVWQQVLNIDGISFTQYAYFGSVSNETGQPFNFDYNAGSAYTGNVEGAGFDTNCTTSTRSFDLTPSDFQVITTGRIFSSLVTWDAEYPNDIRIAISWKNTTSCAGTLVTRSCHLRAATVIYPVQIQTILNGTNYPGPFYSLIRRPPASNLVNDTVCILPTNPDEGTNNAWTYRGIAQSLAQTFNSSITATSSYETSSPGDLTVEGQLAFNLGPTYPPGWQYQCNMTFDVGLRDLAYFQLIEANSTSLSPFVSHGLAPPDSADPAQIIISRLRQAMFLASIYSGSSAFGSSYRFSNAPLNESFQEITAVQETPIARYTIRLYLWGVSLAITYIVIACMVPLFWGFWHLTRHPGTTPVDFARAFHKTGRREDERAMNGDIELKRVSEKSPRSSVGSRIRKR